MNIYKLGPNTLIGTAMTVTIAFFLLLFVCILFQNRHPYLIEDNLLYLTLVTRICLI